MEISVVAAVYGGRLSVLIQGTRREAVTSSKLLTQLSVGDEVEVDTSAEPACILAIKPRRTVLKRNRGETSSRHHKQEQVIAANVDVAVIVTTAAQPDFEAELVDRYIILCRAGGIAPIICLNKAELTAARHPLLAWLKEQGLPVIETSATAGTGINELRQAIRGKTTILIGKSGVGKSSLLLALAPHLDIKTQDINQRGQQGRHTTSRSEIYVWEPDSFLIDTPGIRTLDVSHLDTDAVLLAFPDIVELAHNCRFHDCRHQQEPDCAVQQALAHNQLPTYRWQSYQKILNPGRPARI